MNFENEGIGTASIIHLTHIAKSFFILIISFTLINFFLSNSFSHQALFPNSYNQSFNLCGKQKFFVLHFFSKFLLLSIQYERAIYTTQLILRKLSLLLYIYSQYPLGSDEKKFQIVSLGYIDRPRMVME